MKAVDLYPGLSYHDYDNGFLVMLLRQGRADPSMWTTLVLDRHGEFDIMWESAHTVRILVARLQLDVEKTVEIVC